MAQYAGDFRMEEGTDAKIQSINAHISLMTIAEFSRRNQEGQRLYKSIVRRPSTPSRQVPFLTAALLQLRELLKLRRFPGRSNIVGNGMADELS